MSPRIVSLVPSVTETLVSWGRPPIAGTRFCEQAGLTAVGGTKDPNIPAIVSLRPDLVVMDREENRREDHDVLVDAGLDVHPLAIRSLDDLDVQLPALAQRVGAEWTPLNSPGPPPPTATALVLIWKRPYMALGAGTYAASLLARLGLGMIDLGPDRYGEIDLAATGPDVDVVIAPDEPYPFGERHRSELEVVAPVRFVDGRDLFWWGERSRSAPERLAGVLGVPTPGQRRAHDSAVTRGDVGYIDPGSGLFVFTSAHLAGRPCCENGCRHCPW